MFIVYLGLVRAVLAFMLYFYITTPLITRHSLFIKQCMGYTIRCVVQQRSNMGDIDDA